MINGLKAGTKITVGNPADERREAATVGRVYANMLPLPDGYVPVKCAADGARLLVHKQYITEVSA